MTYMKSLLIAAPVAVGLLSAPVAHAEWRGHGGGGHGGWGHRGGGWGGHHGNGALTGALLGLGAAAVIGGVIASQPQYYAPPPPVYYAPQPQYYYSYPQQRYYYGE